jgi:hypothetical protein
MIDLVIAGIIALSPVDPNDCTQAHPCYDGHTPSFNDPACRGNYCPPDEEEIPSTD